MDEFPRAYVVLKEQAKGRITEEELVAWIGERVARHKRLTGGIVFVQQIPKNPTGKIQRKVLKQWTREDSLSTSRARL